MRAVITYICLCGEGMQPVYQIACKPSLCNSVRSELKCKPGVKDPNTMRVLLYSTLSILSHRPLPLSFILANYLQFPLIRTFSHVTLKKIQCIERLAQ
jgi:hypothetical protein